jgi:hypothetical protein
MAPANLDVTQGLWGIMGTRPSRPDPLRIYLDETGSAAKPAGPKYITMGTLIGCRSADLLSR